MECLIVRLKTATNVKAKIVNLNSQLGSQYQSVYVNQKANKSINTVKELSL